MVTYYVTPVRPNVSFGVTKQWALIKYFHAGEGRPFAKTVELSRHNSEAAARKAMAKADRESVEPVFTPA